MLQNWKELLPIHAAAPEHPYADLSEAQLRRLARLARTRWLIRTGRDSPDGASAREEANILRSFGEEGLDADWLLSRRREVRNERIHRAYHAGVEGQRVTLAGLVLPLQWDIDNMQTRRFLIAPDLSECSHEPPPNHSQVAYVEAPHPVDLLPGTAHMVDGDPCVLIEGRIRFAAKFHSAFRVDGLMRVDSSYVIEPTAIHPASAADIAR